MVDIFCNHCNKVCCSDCQAANAQCCPKFNNGALIAANTLAYVNPLGFITGPITNILTIGSAACSECNCSRDQHVSK